MRHEIRVHRRRLEQGFAGEAFEGCQHSLRGLAGGGQVFHAGAVGRLLLAALVGEQRAPDQLLRARHHADHAGIVHADRRRPVAARRHRLRADGGDARQHAGDRQDLRARQFFALARQMAARDMAGFVSQHADHLVRRLGFDQRADVDENLLPVGDEGVEAAVADQNDLRGARIDPGRAEDRSGIVAHELLDLRIADDLHARRLRGRRRRRVGERRAQRKQARPA